MGITRGPNESDPYPSRRKRPSRLAELKKAVMSTRRTKNPPDGR